MEAPHPFLESAVVGIDVVDVKLRHLRLWITRGRQNVERQPGAPREGDDRRSASQHNCAGRTITPPKALVMEAVSRRGRTASIVAPLRSRATMIGICSTDRPRLAALPPRLRAARGRSERLPLKDSGMNVSSASTIPDRCCGLSRLSAARNRWRQRKAVV